MDKTKLDLNKRCSLLSWRTVSIAGLLVLPWSGLGVTVRVDIVNFTYEPPSVTIEQGDSVLWTQKDAIRHSSTSDSAGLWDSGLLSMGQTFTNTFEKPGDFPYHCSLHSRMKASVSVKAAGTNTPPAQTPGYLVHNLVSDLSGQADVTDTNLVNPWGIATGPATPFWINDNRSGLSTLYNSTGGVVKLVVPVPTPSNAQPPSAPTGIVFNGDTNAFLISPKLPARFIFATEDGTISAWAPGTNAIVKVDNSGSSAVYKGLALATSSGNSFLFAADFHNGKVDVFDSSFKPVELRDGFVDSSLPARYAPFGIQNVGGNLYVTYALQDSDALDDVSGPGNGFVNTFDPAGKMLKRFASQGVLNSPWGIAMAPLGFGEFSAAVLIGNFGDGMINAFDPTTGAPLGQIHDTNGSPLSIQGLWGLKFGNGGQGGESAKLYFTAGIPGSGSVEDHGLFGSIAAISTLSLTASGSSNGVALAWSGGTPPFLVQKKTSLSETSWADFLTTTSQSAIVPKEGGAAFYRVLDHAPTTRQ